MPDFKYFRDHILANEKDVSHPYLDSQGYITVGPGLKIEGGNSQETADNFKRLPWVVGNPSGGDTRPAAEAEIQAGLDAMRAEQAKGAGNRASYAYRATTNLTLPDAERARLFDGEIETRIGRIKGEVGADSWGKLTDGQKAAVLDIHYAKGGLDGFDTLKKAIQGGDAEGMAREASFFSGKNPDGSKIRNWEREARNQAAILGISQEEGRRAVFDKYQGKETPKFDGPVAPPKNTRSDAEDLVPADPQIASMLEMSASPIDNPGRSALLKSVDTLTEGEMKDMIASAQGDYTGWRSGDPLKAHTYEKVQDWHLANYGDQPQASDGGKPVDPQPIRAIPDAPSPHTTPDGEDLWQATGRVGQKVADAAASDGSENAVKGLQRGLNMLNDANPLPDRSGAYGPYTKLAPVAEDGQYGPQTDFALKHATARLGPDKVEEGMALGRFNTFAREAQKSGNAEGLEDKTHSIFGPLLRDGADSDAPKPEAGVLQKTLNDLGGKSGDDWQDLKVDNWIGPKTTEAFGTVLKTEDADKVTQAFGQGLGFL